MLGKLASVFKTQRKESVTRFLLPVVTLLVLLSATTYRDARLLFAHQVAVGVDGYYYVLQVDHIRSDGHPYFSTPTPLILYFLAGLSGLTNDAISAVKSGSLVLHALLSLGLYALIAKSTRIPWFGVLGAGLTTLS